MVSEDNEEEAPMSRSFSVEDLLDEVEKICYDASGTSKVRDKFTLESQISANVQPTFLSL